MDVENCYGSIFNNMSSLNLNELNIKVFADGADLKNILNLNLNPIIKGFTTNPTLMRKSGISNYKEFALEVLKSIKNINKYTFNHKKETFDVF